MSAEKAAVRVVVRRGLDLAISGRPAGCLEDAPPVGSVALLGDDYPIQRFEMHVEEGARVALGQTLFADRRRPALRFVSPGAGTVSAIRRGEGRRLVAVVVELDGEASHEFPVPKPDALGDLGRDALTELLLASGAWVAFRERPFSGIPNPGDVPAALFVHAIETNPLASDPASLLSERNDDFRLALRALAHLTDGCVYVCLGPHEAPPLPDHQRVRAVRFAGPHPAGLVGTHIHRLCPVSATRRVWHIGSQDVLAIGALLRTGHVDPVRIVTLAGPSVRRPRRLRTRLGASTEDLVRGELIPGACRIISGSVLAGRPALEPAAFLGRYHEQICVLPLAADVPTRDRAWLIPGLRGARRVPFWRSLPSWAVHTHSPARALLPTDAFERVFPLRLPIGLLLRALAAGDVESAERYGALALAEEDLALCSYLCPSKLDYGSLLRRALGEIEAGLA